MGQGAWKLFHQRATFVRKLTVDFRDVRLPQYLRIYGFVDPGSRNRRSRTIFPEITSLGITFNRNDAHLLGRFICSSLRELHMTVYPPFPGSALMASILASLEGLKALVRIKMTFAEESQMRQDSPCKATSFLRLLSPPGRRHDVDWVAALLRQLPSLQEVELEGCLITPGVQAAVCTLSKLKRFAACVDRDVLHRVAGPRWPGVEDVVLSLPAMHINDLRIQNASTTDIFNMELLTRFTLLAAIDILIADNQSPIRMESLSAITTLERVSIRHPTLDRTLTPRIFHSLIRSWPLLSTLVLAVPTTPHIPCFAQRPRPVLHLRDLAALGEYCPRLQYLLISVACQSGDPLPKPSHPITNPTFLDLHDIGLSIEDCQAPLDFLRHLFPNIQWLQVGYPYEAWRPLHEENSAHEGHESEATP